MVVRKTKNVDLGGSGDRDGFTLEVVGCECRTADFEFAFRKFANDWVSAANKRRSALPVPVNSEVKPCGCQDNA